MVKNKNNQKSNLKPKEATLIDYKNTHNIIHSLPKELISNEKIGNANLIKINLSPNQEIFNTESKRTEEFLSKNPKLKLIKNYVEEINYPFTIVLVFGSYVKDTKTKTSDIDICIISDNEEKTKKLLERLNLLSLKIEIHKFTANEFISMIEKSQRNLGHEIVKNNIILYGAENYYNLISKWMKKE